MTLSPPYPPELLRIARKVVWFDTAEQTLADLIQFLPQLMMYGSARDLEEAQRFIPAEDFRRALELAPPGVFTTEAWVAWHRRLSIDPIPPLPRRRFPDGSEGPEPGSFFGR